MAEGGGVIAQVIIELDVEGTRKSFAQLAEIVTSVAGGIKPVKIELDTKDAEAKIKDLISKLNDSKLGNIKMDTSGVGSDIQKISQNISNITDQINKLIETAERAPKRVSNTTKTLESGTKAYEARLTRLYGLQNRVNEALVFNSAAGSSKATSGAYDNLSGVASQIAELESQMKSGKISAKDFDVQFAALSRTVSASTSSFKVAGLNFRSFAGMFSAIPQEIMRYFSAARVAAQIVRTVRQSISDAVELQSSLADLQIVTGASGDELEEYSKKAVNTAKALGVATKDVVSATTTYARLGYDINESDVLSKYTTMLEKVGNIGAEEAQNAVTAILAAFKDDASVDNIESVMDKLVAVGKEVAQGCSNAA